MKRIFAMGIMALAFNMAVAQTNPQVEKILSGMTVREKVAQLIVPAVDEHVRNTARRDLQRSYAKEGVGGMIVMDGDLAPFMETMNEVQAMSKIPMMIAIDGEWGVSMRFSEYPYFPKQMQLGALKNPDMIYEMGRAVGKEMKMAHIGVNYAPDVDINCNAQNPVINTRSFGEDREKVARYGMLYAKGMQDEGVSACAKHYPGHGDTSVDSHRALPVLNFSRSRLDSLELYPFRYLSENGVDMIMLAHLSVPALDPSGMPTSVSKPVIDMLRNEIGFKGLIVTDALSMAGVKGYFENDGPRTCLAAYEAGVDVLLMPANVIGCIDLIQSKIESGELPLEDLDNRVRKVLLQKAAQGMLDPDYNRILDVPALCAQVAQAPEKELIARLSEQTIVRVKNSCGKVLRGKVAYLALGAGQEKRIPTMDEDPNKPAEGQGDGPAAYGARRGVGASGAETLSETLGVDSYFLPRGFKLEDLKEICGKLQGYRTVVIGFHDTDTRPQKNYGIEDPEIYDYIGQWAENGKQRLVGVYCGSPYALDVMPWYKDFKQFYIAWADNVYNCSAVGRIIRGESKAQGVMPVSAGGLKCGTAK